MVTNLGQWHYVDRHRKLKLFASQGLTTNGSGSRLYRGEYSIPRSIKRLGWVHIGDPDFSHGHVFDAYQGAEGARSKMYRVTTPAGEHFEYVHQLEGDEQLNNSYVAISPDGQWMISGEWGVMTRLLMFPTPILNPATAPMGGTLSLSGMITLDHPARNVQGATFLDATHLLCSTNDADTDLWPTPRQLLQIDLAGPLTGATMTAKVTSLGELPTESRCSGTFEVEGIDYDPSTGNLRVVIIPPGLCSLLPVTYTFRRP